MAFPIADSLLESPPSPVLAPSVEWAIGLLSGSVGSALAVAAVAVLGFTALAGRLPIRRGGQVILGIFILFGASAVASVFTTDLGSLGPSEPTVVFDISRQPGRSADLEPVVDETEAEVARLLEAQQAEFASD